MVPIGEVNNVYALAEILGSRVRSLPMSYLGMPLGASHKSVNHHFRPISLCNVIYKVISKLLVSRLRPFMDSHITPFQNAFIQGRTIFDNILIAHEIFDLLGKKGVEKKVLVL